MTVLLLRLAGPLQAWGDSSRFTRRDTRAEPTKSGVLGLLAAADGRRRTDPLEDLAQLRFGVRVDQPGQIVRDFQTAINWETGDRMPLSNRYYLADAVFLAGVEGDRTLLGALSAALDDPVFALYLGRRSCPTEGRVGLGLGEAPLEEALRAHEWLASRWYRRSQPTTVELELVTDSQKDDTDQVETRRDVPISFAPERREYTWREVARRPPVLVANPDGRSSESRAAPLAGPDFIATVEAT